MVNPADLRATGADVAVSPLQSLSSRYELLGRLGAGGMAEVFLARAVGIMDFEKIVVLKRILNNRRSDPYLAGMLRDEARVAAFLSHPNIVQTHDIAIDGDDYFFTMEYLHGETLKKLIHRSRTKSVPIPLELILQIGIGAAAGLHHAHEQTDYEGKPLGIVHRDVSPSNIIVTRQSGVKLIDFGIAKAASGQGGHSGRDREGQGSLHGPGAMPRRGSGPQKRHLRVGHRALRAGDPKPNRSTPTTSSQRCTSSSPRSPPHRPKFGRTVRPNSRRSSSGRWNKDSADRYPTAFEMQEELELVMRDRGLQPLPGALGRYLEHIFGPKPHPWTQRAAKPPPVPRWAWTDMDHTLTARRQQAAAAAAASGQLSRVSTAPGAEPAARPAPPRPDPSGWTAAADVPHDQSNAGTGAGLRAARDLEPSNGASGGRDPLGPDRDRGAHHRWRRGARCWPGLAPRPPSPPTPKRASSPKPALRT